MRSHDVANFPDPDPTDSNTKFPSAQELGVSGSQLQAAVAACQHLLPPGANDQFPAAEVQLLLPGMLRFSQCMRSDGVPNFPDPTTDPQGRPIFPLSSAGISRQESLTPQFSARVHDCEHLLPPQLGGTPIG
jgi:hypothetical protein